MNKVELLAPAGNLEKAKIALLYGADAVYVGGKAFSLRARASNFDIKDIEELTFFAHKLNKKVYVTMNILPHDEDLNGLDEYLISIDMANVDAIITSSITIMNRVKLLNLKLETHVSTQTSIANKEAINFYQRLGCTRCVLAREVNLNEIEYIKNNTNVELEVFIHGGMCASYSGRCVLSNHMTRRDANRGGCAHSCRWNYKLYESTKRLGPKGLFFNMGSKDLMAIRQIPKLIDIGVASLKIEGRMKSTYYLATVIRCYRMLIDEYYCKKSIAEEKFCYYEKEIAKAENRLTGVGFLNGDTTINEQLYDTREEHPTKEYVGFVLDFDEVNYTAVIEQRNYFEIGDEVEFFGPSLSNTKVIIDNIYSIDQNMNVDVARHPLEKLIIKLPIKVSKCDMMRKVK